VPAQGNHKGAPTDLTMSQGSRPERVADQIRGELALLIAREVHDPGIGFVTLTRVHVSADLQLARVYYTALGDETSRRNTERALGKEVAVVNSDAAPPPLMQFPGVPDIRVASHVDNGFDAAIIMECSDLARTGVTGLDRYFVINIDHHPGNTGFGQITWFDPAAAACGEMVFDLVRALGVPLSPEIATHIYLAILTDTGSFHYSSISARTFDICRQALEAGVDPVLVARSVYDANNLGRLKLFGAVLSAMQLDTTGRIAIVYLDHEMAREAGGTYEDTEGLINLP